MSHFNAGNVWGTVVKADARTTKEKKTPYLELEIDCANPQLGNVRAFGRLWGRAKIAAFEEARAADGARFRFRGFYGQYLDEKTERRHSSYTFYDAAEADGAASRAAFVVVGDVAAKEIDGDGEARVTLRVTRPGKELDHEEEMEFFLFDLDPYYEIDVGDLVEVRGVLRKRTPEDFYGASGDDPVRPYVMVTKKRKPPKSLE